MVSCGSDPWTDTQKNELKSQCETEGGSSDYCHCFLEKVMLEYPIAEDAKQLDFESRAEIAHQCIEE